MTYGYNKKLVPFAQQLRKNMTDEEKLLWYGLLKKLPFTVNRQKIIGNYIVDFFIASKRLVIELDGSQHKLLHAQENDQKRDAELHLLGISVLRYTNEEMHRDFTRICESILHRLGLCVEDLKG